MPEGDHDFVFDDSYQAIGYSSNFVLNEDTCCRVCLNSVRPPGAYDYDCVHTTCYCNDVSVNGRDESDYLNWIVCVLAVYRTPGQSTAPSSFFTFGKAMYQDFYSPLRGRWTGCPHQVLSRNVPNCTALYHCTWTKWLNPKTMQFSLVPPRNLVNYTGGPHRKNWKLLWWITRQTLQVDFVAWTALCDLPSSHTDQGVLSCSQRTRAPCIKWWII